MRIPSSLKRGEASISMTPLIDVVFQLLIFFLVTDHLARRDMQLDLALPTAVSGSAAQAAAMPLTVNILPDGQMSLAGRIVTTDDLRRRLAARVAEAGSQIEVRVRSDRSVAYRHVEPVLQACARTGIATVSFAVFRAEEVR